ncbi:MAG TPA: RagB/SusD family nutrient uptake outer membrane protein, partial [Kofleriaceae bacterium]
DTAFTFPAPPFASFNTATKFIKFNRAIRARVAVYLQDYQGALNALKESFLDDTSATPNLATGVFYLYSLGGGDATNGLINKAIYAHPTLQTDAQKQMDGTTPDARYTAKVRPFDATMKEVPGAYGSDPSLKSQLKFQIYPSNTTPLALIRNEELILLKAEALWFTNDHTGALSELNLVRTLSGKLPALLAADVPDDTTFVDKLLYERRYSLMFEGGHRWIDLRRFGRQLPLDAPSHVRNIRFPVPQAECDARPGEQACTINSSDPIN